MLEFVCEWCGKHRRAREKWIVGLAGQRSGVTGNRRQVEILKDWSLPWIAHPLAVHFCCEGHKKKYIELLFSTPAAHLPKEAIARAALLRRRIEQPNRQRPENEVVERHIADEAPASAQSKPKRRRRKAATRTAKTVTSFTNDDRLYARGLGITLESEGDESDPDLQGEPK